MPLIGPESDRPSRAIRRTARTKRKEELSAPLFLSFVGFVRERSRKRRVPRTEGRRSAEDPCGAHPPPGSDGSKETGRLSNKKGPSAKDLLSGKRDSDPRPQPWQGCALPTELFPQYSPQCKRLYQLSYFRKIMCSEDLGTLYLSLRDGKYRANFSFCKIFAGIFSRQGIKNGPGIG